MYKLVDVKFRNCSTVYTFLSNGDFKVGQLLLVRCANGFQVVTAVSDTRYAETKGNANAWALVSIDTEHWNSTIDELNQRQQTRDDILVRLRDMRKDFDEMRIFEQMASANAEAAELLSKLKDLK